LKRILIFLTLTHAFLSFAQEFPPIVKYSPSSYNAGNQNWMISQDQNKFVYFANNEGLLEFNGSEWILYPSPNETIIRSVKVIKDKIYTGSYMEFGFWKRLSNGKLSYTSLSTAIKTKIIDEEQFWNILEYEHWVIFQSLNQIFILDTKTSTFKIITPKDIIFKAFVTPKSIFFQTASDGFFEIEKGQSRLVSNDAFFIENKIVSVFQKKESLLLLTQYNGFFEFKDGIISKWKTDADENLNASSVYCAQENSNGEYVLGTVSNGIFIINSAGKVIYHITQSNGISNNTALSLFEDKDHNIWIGLDNGINCINLKSPIHSFTDNSGILGTVYTSIKHQNKLYIGTNQGLFWKEDDSSNNFKLVSGTKGQVWSLFAKDGTLFCGHDSGTYLIENQVAKLIYSKTGTWKFEAVPSNKNLILQGNYYGIAVLEKINNTWVFRNKIKGFDYSSKFFEFSKPDEIIISHEYKGLFRIKLDADFKQTTFFESYKSPSKGKNAALISFNNSIYYAFKEGVYKLNTKTNQFEKDKQLSQVFTKDEYISGKMMVDQSNRLWFFTKNYINYFSIEKLSSQLKHNIIPIPSNLTNSMLGYENISQLSESQYLIGTTDGYYIINIEDLVFNNFKIEMTDIATNRQNESLEFQSLLEKGSFKHIDNNVTFSFTVAEFNKYINAEYQYLLEGVTKEWSPWNFNSKATFKNLAPGDYTFKVKAKLGNVYAENTVSYSFTILKPWYLSNLALAFYILILLILAFFINKSYQNYYRKQQEKLIEENNRLLEIKELETEQELMRIKNQQLEQDYENKNRELAASTMSLIKKNELLAMIKDDLKNSTENSQNRNIKSVITNINKNINEEDTWNVFAEAFNNADNNFLKNIKQIHTSLTPNDLRLCAYLRLNLSSKEIAPLLNISVRSVEIKRYRLRKKMDLPHEQGLVEYILSI
jgi:ligand-binding sensor domain-containing protein/DNA-binding CsgD family transcriptional regulator